MVRKKLLAVGTLLLVALVIGPQDAGGSSGSIGMFTSPLLAQAAASSGNLLTNGDMNGAGGLYPFYWRPTNHYVAGMWYEWFNTYAIPEFIDGGIPYHNVCYPPPPPGQTCESMDNDSQGYIRWGAPYTAGIYQPVAVTPCVLYTFQIYNNNQEYGYQTKVGINPTGEGLPPFDPSEWADYPDNCPPDYHSECPNPGIQSDAQLPSNIVWSPTHNVKDWTLESVTAEAASTTITVWTYAAAGGPLVSRSTYWDEASLTQVPFSGDRLPSPSGSASGFITHVVTRTVLDNLVIEWDTADDASTQVWYSLITATAPITPAGPHLVYLPIVIRQGGFDYDYATPLDVTPRTHHVAAIQGVQNGDRIDFVALSRRPAGAACRTEVSDYQKIVVAGVPSTILHVYLPMTVR